MPIKKSKDSPWYIEGKKIYTCLDCGDEYYTQYKGNNNKCMFCAIGEELKTKYNNGKR